MTEIGTRTAPNRMSTNRAAAAATSFVPSYAPMRRIFAPLSCRQTGKSSKKLRGGATPKPRETNSPKARSSSAVRIVLNFAVIASKGFGSIVQV